MALAASFLLVPVVASAQTVTPPKYDIKNGVGFNKYLVSDKPDANSEYTLRIETFVTGGVKSTAIPTDFVLVLDGSGSMKYDYRPNGLDAPMNDSATSWSQLKPYLMHVPTDDEYSRFSVYFTYKTGSVGAGGSGNPESATQRHQTRSYYTHFHDEDNSSHFASLYYYYEDASTPSNTGYYKIFRRMFDASDGHLLVSSSYDLTSSSTTWSKYPSDQVSGTKSTVTKPATIYYNLAIKLKDNTYKYLSGTGLSDTPYNATANNTIMFINNGNIWRFPRRGEALMDGVEGFVNLIARENAKDQWREDIPAKHQVAIVRFAGNYADNNPDRIQEYTSYTVATHVMKGFTEITDSTAFNNDIRDRYLTNGSTYTDYAMHLTRLLLQDLQTKDGGIYKARNSSGGVNRNKVVVFFTDGQPSNHGVSGNNSFYSTVTPTVRDGKYVKRVGANEINAKIYAIDLAMTASTKAFLEHLSSNYPYGDVSVNSGAWDANNPKFTGDKVPIAGDQNFKDDSPIYYKDSSDGDLTSVFSNIAAGNTGQQAGEELIMMDVMSDSFEIPANAGDKIKLYTAQCIGLTGDYVKDDEDNQIPELAFAEPVLAGSRDALQHIWVYRQGTDPTATGTWLDLAAGTDDGYKVDANLKATKASDGKSIIISGFEFVDMWCGLDEVADHYASATAGNTRQMAADDPNAGFALDGYRGFKVIIEFPIIVSEGAVGGSGVPTNKERESGFYHSEDGETASGTPIINYQKPKLTIPVMLAVRKEGLGPNESASFTVQMKKIDGSEDWHDYATFVLTCTEDDDKPIQKLINLNPDYYYRIKENNWSWAYSNKAQVEATFPSTDPEDPNYVSSNPIVIVNTPIPNPPKHAEAVSRNDMHSY